MRCPRHTEQPVPCRHKVSCVTLLGAGVDGTSTRPLLAEGPPSTSNVKLVSRHSVGSFLSVETGVSESRTGYGHPYSLPLRLRPSLLVTGYGHPYSLPLRPSLLVTATAIPTRYRYGHPYSLPLRLSPSHLPLRRARTDICWRGDRKDARTRTYFRRPYPHVLTCCGELGDIAANTGASDITSKR